MNNICLNMIVRNEAKVIPRLLASVKNCIDYYVISDTGSTDGTQELITRIMKDYNIPGEVHEHKWVNFSVNRNLALQAAVSANKTDFVLIIDADDELKYRDTTWIKELDNNYYYNTCKHYGKWLVSIPFLLNIKKGKWEWKAPVHEYVVNINKLPVKSLSNVAWIHVNTGQGWRSTSCTNEEKYLKDAKLLEEELLKNPTDPRSQYYLAQSYNCAGKKDEAITNYKKVLEMNGWIEEKYVAVWNIIHILIEKNCSVNEISDWVKKSFKIMPDRLEAIHEFLVWCRGKNNFKISYDLCKSLNLLKEHKLSNAQLRKIFDVYEYQIYDELSICSYYSEDYQASKEMCEKALKSTNLPEDVRKRIQNNLKLTTDKIKQDQEKNNLKTILNNNLRVYVHLPTGNYHLWFENIFNLIVNSLKDLGYYTDDYKSSTVAIFIANIPNEFLVDKCNKKIILIQTEQQYAPQYNIAQYHKLLPHIRIWGFDISLSKKEEYLILGYHPSLEKHYNVAKTIDVGHFGTVRQRRNLFFQKVMYKPADISSWGEKKIENIHKTKININLHSYKECSYTEWDRLSVLLANKCFILSEALYCPIIIPQFINIGDYDQKIEFWLNNPSKMEEISEINYQNYKKNFDMRNILNKKLEGK